MFLELLMEEFHQFTPHKPTGEKHKATVTVGFIDQSSRDIKRKLKKLEGLQNQMLREIVQGAAKVYYDKEAEEEEKEERWQKEQEARKEKKTRGRGG